MPIFKQLLLLPIRSPTIAQPHLCASPSTLHTLGFKVESDYIARDRQPCVTDAAFLIQAETCFPTSARPTAQPHPSDHIDLTLQLVIPSIGHAGFSLLLSR